MHGNILTMLIISFLYYCKKVFILMNIWMIGKRSVKHHYLKKKIFYSHLSMEDITGADYAHKKRVCKDFEKNVQENVMICMFNVMHYCQLMYLRILEIFVLNYMNFIPKKFFHFWISMECSFKKDKRKVRSFN